jgi:hypothetical protein
MCACQPVTLHAQSALVPVDQLARRAVTPRYSLIVPLTYGQQLIATATNT